MARKNKQIYFVQLFVVSRLEQTAVAADSKASAARLARDWYRRYREDIASGEFIPGDEISHLLVRADGEAELTAELFESAENPLISILMDFVACHEGAPHAKPLAEIVEAARERVRYLV